MKKRYIALSALALVGLGAGTAAFVASPTVHEGMPGETPELGRFGEYQVGTNELAIALPGRITFSKVGMGTGQVEEEVRELRVRMYYPASAASGAEPITYNHTMTPPAMEPVALEYQGRAFSGAGPVTDQQFPLVIMSHGFNGWNTQFSNLAEHIASRGYIVASIDHADAKIEGVTDFVHSFTKVLASRSLDQRGVLADLLARGQSDDAGMFAAIDPENIAVVGYSMGGYGALASGGGDYDYDSETFARVPEDALAPLRAAASEDAGIDAVIAFAPWGGQPDNRVWSKDTLAKVDVPVLLIAGSEDDVSNHAEGISWIFDQLSGTARHMLVFREARHNIVGNDFEVPADAPFRVAEFLAEPVWRQDRINGINQHFVAAFLDLHLKGDADKASYLDVPTPNANDSNWETSFGEQLNGKLAGPDEAEHWRGFQRRWAIGLDLLRKSAGE